MTSLDLRQSLLQTSLCKYLDLTEVDMLMDFSKLVAFAPGEVLLKQGDKSNGIYIIIEGSARVSAHVLGAGDYKITMLDQGNFVGEISLVQQTPSTTSIIADTSMQCLFIAKNYFDTLAIFFPATKFKISKVITEEIWSRLKEMQQKIISYMIQSDMVAQSFFSELMQSFSREIETTLEKAQVSKTYLSKLEIFKQFSEDEFNYILQHSVLIDVTSRCVLIKENEKNDSVYFLIRGAVQSSIVYKNVVAKLSVIGPVAMFGCMSCVNAEPAMVNFSSCEHAILLKISKENLATIENEHPKIWYKIYDLISQSFAGLEQAANKLEVRLHSELYNR